MTHTSLKSLFTGIADAIRAKEGSTDAIVADDFPSRIASIQMGDTAVEDALLTGNGLTEYTNDRVETVNAYAFSSPYLREIGTKITLKKVHLQNAKHVGTGVFIGCEFLEEAIIPNATVIGQDAFALCSSLREANFKYATHIGINAFDQCSKLQRVDTLAAHLGFTAFRGCTSLATLAMRNPDTIPYVEENYLVGTPLGGGSGYIYVPRALVESYKVARNWSTYASQFRALEDYTIDGTITGDLDESKI